jgi:hypothetical protein
LEDALDGIRKIRPQAEPNIGFLAALKAIEQEHGDVKNAIQRWGEKTPKTQSTRKKGVSWIVIIRDIHIPSLLRKI